MFFDLSILFADEELPRKPQQARSRLKQQAIFEAAAELLLEKGYNSTNTNDIAKRAGVSIGTLYFNFKDKRQILLSMLANQVQGYAGLGDVDPEAVRTDPRGYLADQLQLAFPYNRIYYSIADAVRELSSQDARFRARLGLLGQAIYQRMHNIIEVGIAADMTHPNLDINTSTYTASSLIFNFYAILPNPGEVSEHNYWRHHHAAVQMVCHSIFKDQYVT